jgi:16S rRNA (guanine527-N7)-methyltransferase
MGAQKNGLISSQFSACLFPVAFLAIHRWLLLIDLQLAYTPPVHLDEEACLAKLSLAWRFPLTSEMSGKLIKFSRLLIAWNARINLTGARTTLDVIGEHVVDSFAMAQLVPASCSLIDVGAGGGFPGIPLVILRPEARTTLLEPRAKRIAFLHMVRRELGLGNASIVRGRSDAWQQGGFDFASSRATFSPEEWLPLGLRLARSGGQVLVFANEPWIPTDSPLRATNAISYRTMHGSARWLGSFCST